jgi:hypothetical protein
MGKTVDQNNEQLGPEMKLDAHNLILHRNPSVTSDHTTSSRTSKKSKGNGFMDKLIGGKHAKK